MSAQILHNSAALNALKRHQLVSLSKRYGLKASGKNVDMIERLQAHALTLPLETDFHIPSPEATPLPSRILRSAATPSATTLTSTFEGGPIINEPYDGSDGSPTPTKATTRPAQPSHLSAPTDDAENSFVLPDTLGPQSQLNHKASIISTVSASWSILSESDASIMESAHGAGDEGDARGMGSVRGWKSAGNGEALLEFGVPADRPDFGTRSSSGARSAGSRNSLFALASSITRSGSRHLLSRPSAAPSASYTGSTTTSTGIATDDPSTPTRVSDIEAAEEIVESATAPSPASTIGIPRRHSKVTLLERPSTLRLCSPAPQTPGRVSFGTTNPSGPSGLDDDEEQLPFVTSAQKLRAVKMKDRRSMTPGRYSSGKVSAPGSSSKEGKKKGSLTPSMKARIMGRKSMPAAVHFAPLAPPAPGGFNLGSHTQPLGDCTPEGDHTAPFMAASIYPPIPILHHGSTTPTGTAVTTTLFRPDSDAPPVPPIPAMPMPGTWFTSASSSGHSNTVASSTTPVNSPPNAASTFAFGTDSPGVSSAQFTSAAQAILDQMNAKLPAGQRIGEELLKGKSAKAGSNVQGAIGADGERKTSGGWGLSAKGRDRFAAAHEREFAKMQSIGHKPKGRFGIPVKSRSHAPLPNAAPSGPSTLEPMTPGKKRKLGGGKSVTTLLAGDSATAVANMPSAPNGAPMPGSALKRRRTRLSQGPEAIMGTLRVAGRSMMNLLDDGKGEEGDKTPVRRKGTLKQRLSLLRPFKRAATADDMRLSSRGIAHIASEARERRLSARTSQLAAHTPSRSPTETAFRTASVTQAKPTTMTAAAPKARMPSAMSTQTASTSRTSSSGRLPTRSPIPDFGQARVRPTAKRSASGSSATAGSVGAVGSISKKQSQADVIRTARPAPPPPSAFSYRSISGIMPAGSGVPNTPSAATVASSTATANAGKTSRKVSGSTLMQPTAASLARMQATVRPPLPSAYGSSASYLPPVKEGDAGAIATAKTARPLPRPPSTMFKSAPIATSNPFGKGESRENLFESTFNALPSPRPLPTIPSMSPIKLPEPSTSTNASTTTPLGERPLSNVMPSPAAFPTFPSVPSTDFTYNGKPKTPPSTKYPPRTPKGTSTPGKRGAYAGHTTSSAARVRTNSTIKLKSKGSTSSTAVVGGLARGGPGGSGSGSLMGFKSRGDLKGEVDAQRRKAELRGRMERRQEERELREMLGGLGGDVDMGK